MCDHCNFIVIAFFLFGECNRGILLDDSGDSDFVNPVFISSIRVGMYTTFCYRLPYEMLVMKCVNNVLVIKCILIKG